MRNDRSITRAELAALILLAVAGILVSGFLVLAFNYPERLPWYRPVVLGPDGRAEHYFFCPGTRVRRVARVGDLEPNEA